MLPISLFLWIVLEIAGYLYIGRHFMHLDWPLAIVGAINCLLGLRFWINATTWAFGMAFASPAPRLGFIRRLSIMVAEYLAFLLTFLLVIPFERLWMPADRLPTGQQPILLVHGYGCSRGIWWLLRRRLEAAGHTVASVSLIPPYTSMGKLVPHRHRPERPRNAAGVAMAARHGERSGEHSIHQPAQRLRQLRYAARQSTPAWRPRCRTATGRPHRHAL